MTEESEGGRQVIAPQIVIGFRHLFHSFKSSHTRTCIVKNNIKSSGFMTVSGKRRSERFTTPACRLFPQSARIDS